MCRSRTCCSSSTTSSGFTQAGSEVSTLLGRMPSAVGYQPNLADEMGILQERITSTRGHSITSLQAIYVPADDYTDPAPATTFAHLDATTELSREIASPRPVPGRRPADLDQPHPGPPLPGRRPLHARDPGQGDPAEEQGTAGDHRDPRCRRAVRRGQGHRVACPPHPAVPLAEHLHGEEVHRRGGLHRSAEGRPSSPSTKIADGDYDSVAEQAFFNVGDLDDVDEKWAQIQKENG